MAEPIGLPEGFTLESPGLPEGFTLEKPSIGEDIAKTIPSAAVRAAAGAAGTPGSIRELNASTIARLSNLLPAGYQVGQDTASKILRHFPLMGGPTPEQITKGIEENITGPLYESKTPIGQAAGTATELAASLIGPKAGIVQRALSGVVAPTAAIEATRGTGLEIPTAIGATALTHRALTPKTPINALSNTAIMKDATDTYKELRAGHVQQPIPTAELEGVQSQIRNVLQEEGPNQELAKKAYRLVDKITDTAGRQPPITQTKTELAGPGFHIAEDIVKPQADIADLVAARENMKALFRNPKPSENKAVAAKSLPVIDAAIERLSPSTMQRLKDADAGYSIAKSSQTLDKKQTIAELRAAGENSGLNYGNKLRQNITNFLVSPQSKFQYQQS